MYENTNNETLFKTASILDYILNPVISSFTRFFVKLIKML